MLPLHQQSMVARRRIALRILAYETNVLLLHYPAMVAETGFAPAPLAYETSEKLILHSALKKALLVEELFMFILDIPFNNTYYALPRNLSLAGCDKLQV